MEITPDWIIRTNSYREEKLRWKAVLRIDETQNHIFIVDTAASALPIPKRSFQNQEEAKKFVQEAKSFLQGNDQSKALQG